MYIYKYTLYLLNIHPLPFLRIVQQDLIVRFVYAADFKYYGDIMDLECYL